MRPITAGVLLALGVHAAYAQAGIKHQIEIPEQGLGSAIATLARQTNIQVVYSAGLVEGRRAQSLSGSMTPEEALDSLLAETGLGFEFLDPRTVTLSAQRAGGVTSQQPVTAAPLMQTSERSEPQRLRLAQAGDGAPTSPGRSIDEVLVTASRIARSGFTAPTPTTVVAEADVQRTAPLQVSEALLQIPTFRTAGTSSTANVYANLRATGPQRTLLLVNGRRHVPSQSDGTVDLNLVPASMVERMEVVTGGASASWGSDAVAGVVNLILKTDLEGVTGNVQWGISERDDDEGYSGSLAAGTSFASGRGHVLFGAEYAKSDGIRGLQPPNLSRPWAGRTSVGNSAFLANGLPGTIYTEDGRRADVSDGGLITSGPLRGLQFGPNGTTSQFGYGQVFGNNMIGGTDNYGDTPTPGGDLKFPFERYSAMVHVKYDLTDSLELFAEGTYASSVSEGLTIPGRNNGALTPQNCTSTTIASALGSINVHIDNAFLPAHVRQMMVDAGITCFAMGRTFRDPGMGEFTVEDGTPDLYRGVVGLKGDINEHWSWDAYVQYGKNRFVQHRKGNINMTNMRRAVNAVVDPVTNQIVCADTISANPTVRAAAAGCVPFNLFGSGSPSQAAIDYVTGTSWLRSDTEQTVAAFNVRGNLGATWAGPISFAAGVEYREEKIDAIADPLSEANVWHTSNRKAIAGNYDVKEIYAETVLPLASNAAAADSLELDLAARYTDYSSSGGVTTWKAGLSWAINEQVRIRATQSRDIRAGNLGELFTPTAVGIQNVRHPLTADVLPVPVTTTGNPKLAPEEADTFTAGIVYQPSWLSGLRTSIDYYRIEIDGQIGTLTPNQVADRCYLDNLQSYCAQITTNPSTGAITGLIRGFENLDQFKTSGVDIEAAYRLPISSGALMFRVLGSYLEKLETIAVAAATVTDPAGQYNMPHWTVFGTLAYDGDRFGATVETRWFQGGKIDNTRVEGAIASYGVNINHVGSTALTYLTLTYDLDLPSQNSAQVYLRVNNVFDREPPFPSTGIGDLFDPVGRAYRLGVRFSF
jgi:iron complex outermembrane receptor protein